MFKFLNPIRRYFFPPRKLYRLPAHISAEWDTSRLTKNQQIILMAGLARDPDQAQRVYNQLYKKHGSEVWDYVRLEVRRQRTGTFNERMTRLLRHVFGESDGISTRTDGNDSRVLVDYQFE